MSTLITRAAIVIVAALSAALLRFWMDRRLHSKHAGGARGYLIDCLLASVALLLSLGGMLFIIDATKNLLVQLLAMIGWLAVVVAATSLAPPLRRAQTRLITAKRA